MFEKILGNDHIKAFLENMLTSGRIGNSFLFSGPDGVGKGLFAHEFAKRLIASNTSNSRILDKIDHGNHPDIKHYRPEGKIGVHSIDAMRRFNEEVYLRPYEADWKVFIVHDAERMLSYSANALLKTFEEPAEDSVIILLSSAKHQLIPTILSRCKTLHFHRVGEMEMTHFLIDQYHVPSDKPANRRASSKGTWY